MPKRNSKTTKNESYLMMKDMIVDWKAEIGGELKKIDCLRRFERFIKIQFYRTCYYKHLTININDFVLICNDKSGIDRPEMADVCEVLYLFKVFDDEYESDRCRAIVRWFCRKSELPKNCNLTDIDIMDYELIDDQRCDPEISVETMFDQCNVETREISNVAKPKKKGVINWICRYKLQKMGVKYSLVPVIGYVPTNILKTPSKQSKKKVSPQVAEPHAVWLVEQESVSPEKTPLKIKLKRNVTDKECTPQKITTTPSRTKSIMKTPNSEGRTPRGRKRVSMCPNLETHAEYEDEENVTPPKQKRINETPKGRKSHLLSAKKTPRAKSLLSQFTLEQRGSPVVRDDDQMHVARERLHVSAVPKTLPCREKEFREIYSFLEDKLLDDCGGCVYISGVPGTGKTATTTEVIRTLQKAAKKGDVPEFDYIDINGMRLTEPRQAYVQIYRQMSDKTVSWEHAYQLLDKRFNTASARRKMTIMLVDELDILCNRRQDVVYNILNWPTLNSAKLVVVTIANTMDLPERLLMGKITSRLGLTRLTFQAYNFQQLQEIIMARLAGTETFNPDAVQLVARKVAAVSGDCRRALDISRRAVEIAESEKDGKGNTVVSITNVQQALSEMIASPKIQFIKSCTKYEKLWLQAVCAEVSRTGLEEVVFNSVYTQFETIINFSRIYLPAVEHAIGICTRLGSCRLLVCEHGRKDLYMKIMLNVSADDIHYAINSK